MWNNAPIGLLVTMQWGNYEGGCHAAKGTVDSVGDKE